MCGCLVIDVKDDNGGWKVMAIDLSFCMIWDEWGIELIGIGMEGIWGGWRHEILEMKYRKLSIGIVCYAVNNG